MIDAEKILFILYVKDQAVSKDFYKHVFGVEPSLDVEGMTEFEISDNCKIGIMPEGSISKILTGMPHPNSGNGIPRCEVYLYVDDPEKYMANVINNKGRCISKIELRSWGDEVCYCSDPDGHILAFAKIQDRD